MKKAFLALIILSISVPLSIVSAKSKVVVPVKKAVASAAAKKNCNPNYSGCLKIGAVDYDCKGGSGNGPYYTGKVKVIGYDQYGLDRDNDGWGCE